MALTHLDEVCWLWTNYKQEVFYQCFLSPRHSAFWRIPLRFPLMKKEGSCRATWAWISRPQLPFDTLCTPLSKASSRTYVGCFWVTINHENPPPPLCLPPCLVQKIVSGQGIIEAIKFPWACRVKCSHMNIHMQKLLVNMVSVDKCETWIQNLGHYIHNFLTS